MNQNLLNLRINDLRKRILTMPLDQLTGQYNQIEEEVINGILRIIMEELEKQCEEVNGNLLLIDSNPYQLFAQLNALNREFETSLLPQFTSRSKVMKEIKIIHNGFGKVRSTRITFPAKFNKCISPLQPQIQQWVDTIYTSLEAAVISGIEKFQALPLRNIHDLFSRHANLRNVPIVAKKAWFSVSDMEQKVFRYQFSTSQIAQLIEQFKSAEIVQYSPFECLVAILSREIHDAVLDGPVQMDNGVFTIPVQYLGSVKLDLCFWNAEKKMLDCPTLSAVDVALVDRYDLQVNFPTVYAETVKELVEELLPTLEAQFASNIKEYKRSLSALNRLSDKITQQPKLEFILKIVSKFISETIADTIKNLMSP